MERGCRPIRSARGTWSNKDRGSSPPGGWPTMRIRVVTAIGSCPAAEFRPARILRLQHCGGTQIHARGPVESIATRQHRTSNPRIITCMT